MDTTPLPGITFIIPTLNEEANLPRLLESIAGTMGLLNYEIIVSDNGSTDNTHAIANQFGATLIVDKTATISRLRNLGQKKARFPILAFLDADIYLSEDWASNLTKEIESWPKDNLIITGNTYLVPEPPSFIEKHWFSKLIKTGNNYINSGHLITTRELYQLINGFDEGLRTGEDYDFCQRAILAGGKVIKRPSLKAFHYGFPQTVKDFIAREAWHGREDFSSPRRLFRSKTALAAIGSLTAIIITMTLALTSQNLFATLLAATAALSVPVIFTYLKFGADRPINFLLTASCSQLYLMGRLASPFYSLRRPSARS